jgi:CBS domain-containing protein
MPASYRPPVKADLEEKPRTLTQTVETNLKQGDTTVANLLSRKGGDTFSIRPQDTIATAVGVLRDRRIGALVVADDDGNLKGILSERDIVRKLAETPGQTLPQTVAENMTSNVVTCAPDDTLVSVLQRMSEGKFRHMPVIDNGKLAGMVTIGDVINHRLAELEHEALQMRQMIVG